MEERGSDLGGIRVNAVAIFVVVVGPIRDLQILWECLEREGSQNIVHPRFSIEDKQ